MGLHVAPHGENHFKSKLKETDIFDIAKLYNSGIKIIYIAQKYGVSHMSITRILDGTNWRHLKLKELNLVNYKKIKQHESF